MTFSFPDTAGKKELYGSNTCSIYSDFECIIDKSNEDKFISGGYLVKFRNDKFTKPVQMFDNIYDYCENLKNGLKYIEKINDKLLNYKIEMKHFDKKNLIIQLIVNIVIVNLIKIIIVEK